MKQKLLQLTAALLFAQVCSAQIANDLLPSGISDGGFNATPVSKASASTASRLVSYAFLKSDAVNYIYIDSASLTYSGTRGGDFGDILLERSHYDNGLFLQYNTATSSFDNSEKITQTIDANGDVIGLLQMVWDVPTSSWKNDLNVIYTYDGAHNRLSRIQQAWSTVTTAWVNQTKVTYTYDGNNNVTANLSQLWNNASMVWVNNTKVTNIYNAANKITQAFNQQWNSATTTWDNYTRITSTYDANNNNLTERTENWNSSTNAWDNSKLLTYTYSASNQKLTRITQYWNSSTSSWDNNQKTIYSDFSGLNPLTDTTLTWNVSSSAYENYRRNLYTYNTYGQYLSLYGETWNAGGFWQPVLGDLGYRFHYEEYATDVKSLSAQNGTANIYPVPARNLLNIDLNWAEAQPFTVSIIDLQGRVSRQWQVAAAANYHTAISVNELPFGTYIIKIQGTKGQVIKQLIVSPS